MYVCVCVCVCVCVHIQKGKNVSNLGMVKLWSSALKTGNSLPFTVSWPYIKLCMLPVSA